MSLEEAVDAAIDAATQALDSVRLEAEGIVDVDEAVRADALIAELKTQLYGLRAVRQELLSAAVSVSLSPSEFVELQSLTLRLDSSMTGGAIDAKEVLSSAKRVSFLAMIGTDSTGPKIQE